MPKILIIEDDPSYVRAYSHKFEISGYEVSSAVDGEDALEKMRKNKPDLALVDLMMPKMDGFELISQMKKDDGLKDVPIIVLTNLSSAEGTERVLEQGVYSVMIKADNDPNTIVAKAEEILGKKE